MNNNSGTTKSIWMEWPLPLFPRLEKDLTADVCIVGSGIVGLTSAYLLAQKNLSVVVVDQGAICGGQTARTSAHLCWTLDDRFSTLVDYFGVEKAKQAAQSHLAAIRMIEAIIRAEKIACDFEWVNGHLFVPPDEPLDILNKEFTALEQIGMQCEKVLKTPLSPVFDAGPSLKVPGQARFHILKYIDGLLKALKKHPKVQIFSNTHIRSLKDGSPCISETELGHKIHSSHTIVSTCTPSNDRVYIHTKQAAYRTYMIAALIEKNTLSKDLYWDTADPYHYLRTLEHHADSHLEWLLVGGEDHRTGQEKAIEERYEYLENWARLRFPMLRNVEYRWSGQVFEPVDGLAFIGLNPGDKHTYIATGDSGNGLTHGTIAAKLISDLIVGVPNAWQELYSPTRKTLKSASEYISENLNTAMQYGDWLKEWFSEDELKVIDELPPNEGVIIRKGVKKIAVFKDQHNELHFNSAYCPHLAGCVRWNPNEKSWDCPCHGSRFSGEGKNLNGPALNHLEPCVTVSASKEALFE